MRYYPNQDTEHQLDLLLNKGLTLVENFSGVILHVELEEGVNVIHHALGFTPVGYLVLLQQNAGDIYGTETDKWTDEILYLVSSVANQKARLFVM